MTQAMSNKKFGKKQVKAYDSDLTNIINISNKL